MSNELITIASYNHHFVLPKLTVIQEIFPSFNVSHQDVFKIEI